MRRRDKTIYYGVALTLAVAFCGACQTAKDSPASDVGDLPANLVVLNSPADGVVRRVNVGEGVAVAENAAVLEIAVENPTTASPTADPGATLRQQAQEAQAATKRLEERVERAAVEVQRIEPLVASGAAPQPQLDAARAEYQRAQEDLQRSRRGAQTAVAQAGAERQAAPGGNAPAGETIIPLRATSAGTVRVVNARAGQRVSKGQPLITIAAN